MESKFSQWVKNIRDTQEQEINCSACLDQISQYVDLELAAGDAAEHLPKVKQHLDQCQVCREEYLVLRDLARLEASDHLPTIEELAEKLKRRSK